MGQLNSLNALQNRALITQRKEAALVLTTGLSLVSALGLPVAYYGNYSRITQVAVASLPGVSLTASGFYWYIHKTITLVPGDLDGSDPKVEEKLVYVPEYCKQTNKLKCKYKNMEETAEQMREQKSKAWASLEAASGKVWLIPIAFCVAAGLGRVVQGSQEWQPYVALLGICSGNIGIGKFSNLVRERAIASRKLAYLNWREEANKS